MKAAQSIGPVMLDLEGVCLNAAERDRLRHPNTGGVILFSRNYQAPEQVAELIAEIRLTADKPLLIAVDQEGGRVQRFRQGFTLLPPAAHYAFCIQQDWREAAQRAESAGWLMAMELRSVGVDFSFAPVLDVDCGLSEIIGDRSFGKDPALVCELALAFMGGMKRAGMAAVGKHFPGHGGVAPDSHVTLPEDKRHFAQLAQRDLLPFRRLIEAGLEAIMPAHVVYKRVDDKPAGFSPYWLKEILRGALGFKGAIFSDDLSMAGAAWAGDFVQRAQRSLAAGCDMVLICGAPDAADRVLDKLPVVDDPLRQERLLAMRGRFPVEREELMADRDWRTAREALEQMNFEALRKFDG